MADILPTADEAFAPAPEDTRPTADDAFGAAPQAPAPAIKVYSPKLMPAAVRERITQGDAFTNIAKAAGEGSAQGAVAGWNNPDVTSSAAELNGWFDKNVNVGPLRLFNSALTHAASGAYNLLARGASAALGAVQGAGAEAGQAIGKAAGSPQLGNDLSAFMSEYPGAELAGIAPHISRVEVDPATGIMSDGHIGPIPHPTEVPAQAKGIEQVYFGPQVPEAANTNEVGKAVTSLPNVSPETFKSLAEEANLREQHAAVTAQVAELPEGDPSAVDRLARLDAVETQLKDENLSVADRKSLNDRRDQILVDATPEKLKEAAAPIEQRRTLEAQQASIEQRLGDLADTHAKALEEAALSPLPRQTPAQIIESLYHDDGVLPVEVHRDAQLDPTVIADLAIGEKPARYARPDPHLTAVLNSRLDEAATAEPPLALGMVRMYHGGEPGDAKGPLWFSSDRRYAEGYAAKTEGAGVHYVDIPENHPLIEPDYPEQSVARGHHVNRNLPADLASQRKILPGSRERVAAVLSSEQAAVDRRLGGDDILKEAFEQEDASGQLPGVYTQEGPGAARSDAAGSGQPRPAGGEPTTVGAGDTASATLEQGGGATRVAGRSQLLKPIKGTGSLETRGLSEHIDEAATERGLTDGFGDLPGYNTLNMADQSRLANDLLARDPQLAMDIAMGRKPAPQGMAPEAALVAVEKAATAAGDGETLRDLTNTRLATDATTMGQRIRVLGERDPNSAVGAMRMVQNAREAKIKPYLIEKEIKQVTKDAGKALRAAAPKMDVWKSFLAELECK